MTTTNLLRLVPGLIALLLLAACDSNSTTPNQELATPSAGTNTNREVYIVKGVVKEVNPERKRVKIAHEKIPDYMEAMTMNFSVKDAKELEGLNPEDPVTFHMVVTDDDGWVEHIVKDSETTTPSTAAPSSFRIVRDVEPLAVGDPLPNYSFTNELGQVVNLQDLKGNAFAITFLFTRCPFPAFCPRMAGNFAQAQQKLKAAGPKNWHLFTITFDPDYDTPQVLREYAQRFNYDPSKWSFLTAPLIDITAIAEQFGMLFWRPDPTKPAGIEHNLRTVVIDTHGKVHAILTENEWKVDELVNLVVEAAGK